MDRKKKPYKTPKLVVFGSVENLTKMWYTLGPGDWFNSHLPDDVPDLCPWRGCGS